MRCLEHFLNYIHHDSSKMAIEVMQKNTDGRVPYKIVFNKSKIRVARSYIRRAYGSSLIQ